MRRWLLGPALVVVIAASCTSQQHETATAPAVHLKRTQIHYTTLSNLGLSVKAVKPTGPVLCTSHVLAGKPVRFFFTC